MDTSCEKTNRVLDLAWRNYEKINAASDGLAQRSTIVLGASVAGIGIMFNDVDLKSLDSNLDFASITAMVVAISVAFLCTGIVAAPRNKFFPSGTDDNRIWYRLVTQNDPAAAANLLRDICGACESERSSNLKLSWWLTGCVVSCGIAVVASMAVKLLAGA